MTQQELDAAIAEIIIPQKKSRSTQNSHRRKQWENRRNWRLCTIGESCKIGVIKSCKEPYDFFSPRCEDCYGKWWLSSNGRGGVCTDDCKSRYKKFSWNSKSLRDFNNRCVRRYKGDIGDYCYYKKMFEYWYFM